MECRLAAILAADMVGYSRLMGVDEAGTLARLKVLRAEVVDPQIATHRGRVVKLMGAGEGPRSGGALPLLKRAREGYDSS